MSKKEYDIKTEMIKNKLKEKIEKGNNSELLNKELNNILYDMEHVEYYFMYIHPKNIASLLLVIGYSEDEMTKLMNQIYSKDNVIEFNEYEKVRKKNLLKGLMPRILNRIKNKDKNDSEIDER